MATDTAAPTIADLARSGELARLRAQYSSDLDLYRAVTGKNEARFCPGSFRVAMKESQIALRDLRFRDDPEGASEFRPGQQYERFDNAPDIDELRDWYLDVTDREEHALDIEVTLQENERYNCVMASDIHIGPAECAYSKWLSLLEWVLAEPDCGMIVNGDLFNCSTRNSVGLGPVTDRLPFQEQQRLMLADLRPLAEAGKLHALLTGNHDARAAKETGLLLDPVKDMAETLNVPHLGYEGFVRWRVNWQGRREIYTGYHHHGCTGANTSGGVENAIKRLEERNRADYVVMGHVHRLKSTVATHRRVGPDGTIVTAKTPLVVAGSYQRLQGGTYQADKAFEPALIGSGTIWLHGDKHSVHART